MKKYLLVLTQTETLLVLGGVIILLYLIYLIIRPPRYTYTKAIVRIPNGILVEVKKAGDEHEAVSHDTHRYVDLKIDHKKEDYKILIDGKYSLLNQDQIKEVVDQLRAGLEYPIVTI